ncbi:hypothetical protein [Neisseria dumasiana]|uniref:hypothetical protein n=1 Tax=Neisseria dumasiana TaxID=1931275 RepID=UPI000F7A4498|nr:hypothetical protein [Neisseria dumasiana]
MKKFIALLVSLVISSSALAWEFTEISVNNRLFEIRSDYDAVYLVDNVYCTATDGYDSLHIQGYFSPTGRWNYLNRSVSGKNLRQRLKQIEPNLLPAYMNFCARVNRHNYTR